MISQNEKLSELLELMRKHPELPVVAMVNSEVVADNDYSYWMGEWGGSKIDKYWIGEENVHFYDEEDWEGVEYDGADIGVEDDISDEEIDERYKNLPWIEAIVIWIETPNEF